MVELAAAEDVTLLCFIDAAPSHTIENFVPFSGKQRTSQIVEIKSPVLRNHVPFSTASEADTAENSVALVPGRRHSSFFGWFDSEDAFRRESIPAGVNPILQRIFEWVDAVEAHHGAEGGGGEGDSEGGEGEGDEDRARNLSRVPVRDDTMLLALCDDCRRRCERQGHVVLREERQDARDLYITVREEPWAASAVYGYRVARARGLLWFQYEFAEYRIALSFEDSLYIAWRCFADFERLMATVVPMCLPNSMEAWGRVKNARGASDGPFPNLTDPFLARRARAIERLLAHLLQEIPDISVLIDFVQAPQWACRRHRSYF
ncbi:hypothetical protein JKP88DRAFT_327718 [Tribonema minus]|uniref:PX domain-containing protein n=1 Tax=Tribonema minus TaxID=303371 RepID=A0A835YXQ3_9STRA|nr:hypothetical protein JKP88DRAFT_327718 [Tribonema minus]